MNIRRRTCISVFRNQCLSIYAMTVLFFMTSIMSQTFAQDIIPADSATTGPVSKDRTRTLFGGTITNSGYGGIILKFSSFNDQFAFMTGGRGACAINNRYTIGGGGYGIASSIDLPGSSEDTIRIFKMGYGGLELGYIFFHGKMLNFGSTLLIAAGAAFWQNKPESAGEKLFNDDFNFFPVLEPSLYGEVAINRFLWLHAGICYRYVHHANLDYMTDKDMRGFSCYIGLLFGKSE